MAVENLQETGVATEESRYPARNKVKTAFDIVRVVRNWPDALELRFWKNRRSLRLLEFRDGLNVVLRGGSNEWSIIHEFMFVGAYRKALDWIAACTEAKPIVIDLGANIGMFSLVAARENPRAQIFAYEPGPPTVRINRMNMLANPELAERITLTAAAVAGSSGEAHWHFDSENPGGSSLQKSENGTSNGLTKVKLSRFHGSAGPIQGQNSAGQDGYRGLGVGRPGENAPGSVGSRPGSCARASRRSLRPANP